MTLLSFLLVLLSEGCSVCGQICMKHAMTYRERVGKYPIPVFAGAIAAMACGFFVWVGLMPKFDLSYLYPFDGLSRLMLVVGAKVFLKEKMTPALWLGVILISIGVGLVSAS